MGARTVSNSAGEGPPPRVGPADRGELTELLQAWGTGDRQAHERLMSAIYDELRKIAGAMVRRGDGDRTLRPTALVNEAYLRLIQQNRVQWRDRSHFFAIAAKLMRRIAVDQARRKQARKRGGGSLQLSLTGFDVKVPGPTYDPLILDDALDRLAALDPEKASVVELRFFGGLTVREVATVLGRSKSTIERHWETARVWLYRELH